MALQVNKMFPKIPVFFVDYIIINNERNSDMKIIHMEISPNEPELDILVNSIPENIVLTLSGSKAEFLVSIPYLNWSHLFSTSNHTRVYWEEKLKQIPSDKMRRKIASELMEIDFCSLLNKTSEPIDYSVKDLNKKLSEAQYFFEQMKILIEQGNEEYLNYNLSAFTTAARSILQYARESANQKRKLGVYNNHVGGNEVLRFFKDKRDFNIHTKPVTHDKLATTDLYSSLIVRTKESIKIELIKNEEVIEGNMYNPINCDDMHFKENNLESPITTINYVFNDWEGTENMLELIELYLSILEKFIRDLMKKEII